MSTERAWRGKSDVHALLDVSIWLALAPLLVLGAAGGSLGMKRLCSG